MERTSSEKISTTAFALGLLAGGISAVQDDDEAQTYFADRGYTGKDFMGLQRELEKLGLCFYLNPKGAGHGKGE